MVQISVIICTHNPRITYLQRVMNALKDQTLLLDEWELILIDNGSENSLVEQIDLSWHPKSKCILEQTLGLTPARLRGIRESKGDLLVFVDDDNILEKSYLDTLLNKMSSIILLGALGAGKIVAEFETTPSDEVIPFLHMLALREEHRPHYSNEVGWHKAIPYGAGLCIRRSIAMAYVETCKLRLSSVVLDRSGQELLSGGDIDLALHACKEGYLVGIIPELELTHLIPQSRLELTYLINIAAGHAKSHYLLSKLWSYHSSFQENPILRLLRYWKKRIQYGGLAKKIYIAEQNAIKEAQLEFGNY